MKVIKGAKSPILLLFSLYVIHSFIFTGNWRGYQHQLICSSSYSVIGQLIYILTEPCCLRAPTEAATTTTPPPIRPHREDDDGVPFMYYMNPGTGTQQLWRLTCHYQHLFTFLVMIPCAIWSSLFLDGRWRFDKEPRRRSHFKKWVNSEGNFLITRHFPRTHSPLRSVLTLQIYSSKSPFNSIWIRSSTCTPSEGKEARISGKCLHHRPID